MKNQTIIKKWFDWKTHKWSFECDIIFQSSAVRVSSIVFLFVFFQYARLQCAKKAQEARLFINKLFDCLKLFYQCLYTEIPYEKRRNGICFCFILFCYIFVDKNIIFWFNFCFCLHAYWEVILEELHRRFS